MTLDQTRPEDMPEAEDLSLDRKLLAPPTKAVKRLGRPPKHGAYSGADMMPLTVRKRDEIVAVLRGNQVAVGPTDLPYVEMLARALAKVELFDRYMAVNGVFEPDPENPGRMIPAMVLKVYFTAMNTAARMCDQLGLTPKSRIALGIGMIQAEDLAGKMRDVREDD